jgi:hypothetical protein
MERESIIGKLSDYKEKINLNFNKGYKCLYQCYLNKQVVRNFNNGDNCFSNGMKRTKDEIFLIIPYDHCIYYKNFIKRYIKVISKIPHIEKINSNVTEEENGFGVWIECTDNVKTLFTLTVLRYLYEYQYDNFRLIPYWMVYIDYYHKDLNVLANMYISHYNHKTQFSHQGHCVYSNWYEPKFNLDLKLSYDINHTFENSEIAISELKRLKQFKNKQELKITIEKWKQNYM